MIEVYAKASELKDQEQVETFQDGWLRLHATETVLK